MACGPASLSRIALRNPIGHVVRWTVVRVAIGIRASVVSKGIYCIQVVALLETAERNRGGRCTRNVMSGAVPVVWYHVTLIAGYSGMRRRYLQVSLVSADTRQGHIRATTQVRRGSRLCKLVTGSIGVTVTAATGRAHLDQAVNVKSGVQEVAFGVDDLRMTLVTFRLLRVRRGGRQAMTTATRCR